MKITEVGNDIFPKIFLKRPLIYASFSKNVLAKVCVEIWLFLGFDLKVDFYIFYQRLYSQDIFKGIILDVTWELVDTLPGSYCSIVVFSWKWWGTTLPESHAPGGCSTCSSWLGVIWERNLLGWVLVATPRTFKLATTTACAVQHLK